MNKITVVIPNWNGEKFLKTCFDSLQKQTFKNFITILVDNASEDTSVQFTKDNYPEIEIIRLKKNTGFAPAVNVGIKAAKTDLIVLLNNDTEVDKEFLEEFHKAAEKYPDAGLFAAKMLDFKDRTVIDSCGILASWSGRFENRGYLQKDGKEYDNFDYVFGACGGAALYRKNLFDKIGFFDETFFAYCEDTDISFRSQLAGFKCVFVPTARVYHIGSGSSGRQSAFNFKLVVKNRWHVIYKNFPTKKIWRYWPLLLSVDIRFFLAAIKHHFIKDYFWAISQAIKEHHKMIDQRKKIQTSKKVSLRYLDTIIENYSLKKFLIMCKKIMKIS